MGTSKARRSTAETDTARRMPYAGAVALPARPEWAYGVGQGDMSVGAVAVIPDQACGTPCDGAEACPAWPEMALEAVQEGQSGETAVGSTELEAASLSDAFGQSVSSRGAAACQLKTEESERPPGAESQKLVLTVNKVSVNAVTIRATVQVEGHPVQAVVQRPPSGAQTTTIAFRLISGLLWGVLRCLWRLRIIHAACQLKGWSSPALRSRISALHGQSMLHPSLTRCCWDPMYWTHKISLLAPGEGCWSWVIGCHVRWSADRLGSNAW